MKRKFSPTVGVERLRFPLFETGPYFQRAIAECPIPLVVHDENDRVLQVSKGWTRFSGYTMEDIPTIGAWRQRAYGAAETTANLSLDDLFTLNETVDDGEWLITAKDGSKRIWHFMITPLGRHKGLRILLATAVDVTERKRAEDALRKAEELLNQGVHVAGLGIFDHDQVTEGLYWSPEMRAICGLSPDEPVSLPAYIDLIHPDDREAITTAITRAHDPTGDGRFDVEHRLVRRDGSIRWLRIQSQTFFEGEAPARHPVRTVGALLDITGQKLAEEYRDRLIAHEQELRAAAESANKLKDDFLSTLSHELRTPLTAIIGWTSLLRDQRLDKASELRGIDTIDRNARSQQRLIEEILDVSRIISGKFTYNPGPIEMLPIVEAAVESIRPIAEHLGIRFETDLAARDAAVFGDPDRLLQMMSNLLSNAVKFTPEHGTVRVSLLRRNASIRFLVSDTGEGIAPEFLPHIFDRFRQGDSATTRKHGGLGLGLSIVRHIVELHGGAIHAESAGYGKGATFIVDLPVLVTG
ncbi:MAG TPA: ATP-binding protein [Terriglobia bacterium]|nr:ATP-binding protein [Terriglobia bacterium]